MSERTTGLGLVARRKHRARRDAQQDTAQREKVSAVIQEAIQRGKAQGRQELTAELEKISHFRGQVAVHAGASEMLRIKTSVMQGLCYRCHANPIDPTTQDSRCMRCSEGD